MTLTLLPGGAQRDPSLESQVARIRRIKRAESAGGNGPHEPSGYEMVTRQMVESISEDVRDIKSKLNNLVFVLVGAIILDIVSRILGA